MKTPLAIPDIADTALTSSNPYLLINPLYATANITTTLLTTSGTSLAVYVGRVPRTCASMTVRWRVTTGATTVTWAEVAVAKGALNVAGNATLTVVGYTDVASTITSAAVKGTTVAVASGQSLRRGDDAWVIIGNSASTPATLRVQSIADNLAVGVQQSRAVQPSTELGTAVAWTLEAVGNQAAMVALIV